MGSGPAGGTREPRVSEPTRRRRLGSERGHARLDGRAAWGPSSARITSITCSADICQYLSGSAAGSSCSAGRRPGALLVRTPLSPCVLAEGEEHGRTSGRALPTLPRFAHSAALCPARRDPRGASRRHAVRDEACVKIASQRLLGSATLTPGLRALDRGGSCPVTAVGTERDCAAPVPPSVCKYTGDYSTKPLTTIEAPMGKMELGIARLTRALQAFARAAYHLPELLASARVRSLLRGAHLGTCSSNAQCTAQAVHTARCHARWRSTRASTCASPINRPAAGAQQPEPEGRCPVCHARFAVQDAKATRGHPQRDAYCKEKKDGGLPCTLCAAALRCTPEELPWSDRKDPRARGGARRARREAGAHGFAVTSSRADPAQRQV